MISQDELWPRLDEEGEDEVRTKYNEGRYAREKKTLVEAWLKEKQREQAAETAERQEARDDQSLSISEKANTLARRANEISQRSNVIAGWAFVAAIVGLVISLIALFR